MNPGAEERLTLIEESTWRQTALPAGRIAIARGALVLLLLSVAYSGLAPLGPESGPTAQLLANYWNPNPDLGPEWVIQSALVSLLSMFLPVALAVKVLVISQVTLAFGFLVCWMRQLDASRSTVIPTALIVGLSPGLCQLIFDGGVSPLLLLTGSLLVAATDQVRAEAGRGIFFVGLIFGICLAMGPELLPVLLYSLSTMIFDRGIRGLRSRGLLSGLTGLLTGASLILLSSWLLRFSNGNIPPGELFQWVTFPWQNSLRTISNPSIEVLLRATQQWGILVAVVALPGLLWALFRRAGDVTLLLLMMSTGAFVAPMEIQRETGLISPELVNRFALFSSLPAVIFCSWTLTFVHRSLSRFQPTRKILVSLTSVILCVLAPLSVSPPLWAPSSQLVQQWGNAVLETAPQDALLLSGGGSLGPALEATQWLHNTRPDVTILDPWGEVLPTRIGLPLETPESSVHAGVQKLRNHQRPLIMLPTALSHPLIQGQQLQPQALFFAIREPSEPLNTDQHLWEKISLPHLPKTPEKAWKWLKGIDDHPPRRGRLSGKIAADSWLAMARSQNELRFSGRWSSILALLEELQHNPDAVKSWLQDQSDELPGFNPAPVPRTRD